jgi:hypothetical protein
MAEKVNPEHEKFTSALSSVLSVSPEELRQRELEAKDESPSPHTKYKYVPAKAES